MYDKAKRFVQTLTRLGLERGGARGKAVTADSGPSAIEGRLVIKRRDVLPDGRLGSAQVIFDEPTVVVNGPNLVVTQAEGLMANMAAGTANAPLNYIELGNPAPATPPALTDLNLEASTGTRKAVVNTVSGNTVTAATTFLVGEGNGFTYTEAGLFTGPFAGGTMFARKTFAGITKTAAFELTFEWTITFRVSSSGGDCTGIGFSGPTVVTNETYAVAAGAEASCAATFDFTVGAGRLDVFLNGVRLVRGIHYNEAAVLTAPVLGPAANKGVNFVAFVLIPGDEVYLVHRA